MSDYVEFYLGQRRTLVCNMSFDQIIALPDAKLESGHTYIQWLFPMRTLSSAQPGAARQVLTDEAIAQMCDDSIIQRNLDRAVDRMLRFWGLRRVGLDVWVMRPERFEKTVGSDGNHNQLRMSRMLSFLRCLDRAPLAKAILFALELNVSDQSPALKHWRRAVY